VFVPIFQVVRLWSLRKKTNDSMAKYDSASTTSIAKTSLTGDCKNRSSSTLAEKGQSIESLDECIGDRLFTMDALEHVFGKNPTRLQESSALSDFSGENIAFLTELAAWKSRWLGELMRNKSLMHLITHYGYMRTLSVRRTPSLL